MDSLFEVCLKNDKKHIVDDYSLRKLIETSFEFIQSIRKINRIEQ